MMKAAQAAMRVRRVPENSRRWRHHLREHYRWLYRRYDRPNQRLTTRLTAAALDSLT
jgi:hypothetical protein